MKELTPNFTQIPNIILDKFMFDMTESELKVFLYIARRTYGFQKTKDKISLNQICDGIKDKDGDILDHGTGLSKRSVIDSLKKLENINLIISKKKANKVTEFSINVVQNLHHLESSQVVQNLHPSSVKFTPEVVQNLHPQKKEKKSIQNKELFSFEKEKERLEKTNDKINLIVLDYFNYKNLNFNTKQEYNKHRFTFACAKTLASYNYSQKEILAMFNYAENNYKSWTLNAIEKNHKDIIKQLLK